MKPTESAMALFDITQVSDVEQRVMLVDEHGMTIDAGLRSEMEDRYPEFFSELKVQDAIQDMNEMLMALGRVNRILRALTETQLAERGQLHG